MPLNNPSAAVKITTGSYTGNDAANRAIPHSLSKVPKLVRIFEAVIAGGTEGNLGDKTFALVAGYTRIKATPGGANSSLTMTAMDTTNFYVGHATSYDLSANANTKPYLWVAFS